VPNWCDNSAYFKHNNPEKLQELAKAAEEGRLLQYLCPRPDNDDWYSDRLANWGTKWDVDSELVSKDVDGVRVYFQSAWSPPVAAYKYAEENSGWRIEATYVEPAMDFIGDYTDGVDSTYSLNDAPEWLMDEYEWVYDWIAENEEEETDEA